MLPIPDVLTDLNLLSVSFRLVLAVFFGGIIGLERGINRHPAGFRTHILVCVGSTLAMLTNMYIFDIWGNVTDPVRLGAQVITGVGFLGAGTILLTGRNHIRGLTTAAGLWASACLGLAIGAGFYEGALGGAVAIFISLALLPRMENYAYRHSDILNLYVEVASLGAYRDVMKAFRVSEISVYESTLERGDVLTPNGVAFVISLKVPRRMKTIDVLEMIEGFNGVTLVEEL